MVLQDAPQRARKVTTTLRELHEGEAQHVLEAEGGEDNVGDSMDEEVACGMDVEMGEEGTYTEVADQQDLCRCQVDAGPEAADMEEGSHYPAHTNDGGHTLEEEEHDGLSWPGCMVQTANGGFVGVAVMEDFPSAASSELVVAQLESVSEMYENRTHQL